MHAARHLARLHSRLNLKAYRVGVNTAERPRSMAARAKPSQGELAAAALVRSPVPLIDIGVNLVDDAFEKDRREVISRAAAAGVAAIVVTGCSVASSTAAAALCDAVQDYPLFFTAGVHPHNAKDAGPDTLDVLRTLAAHERCVAIGECGLDFNRNFSPPDVQEAWFRSQVALALELGKPLFMHCRDAGERFALILREAGVSGSSSAAAAATTTSSLAQQPASAAAAASSATIVAPAPAPAQLSLPPPPPGMLHCFTGSAAELEACLELGLAVGITGWVADDRPERGGAELAALLPSIPPGRLLIETDAPYLTPRSITPAKARPHRNEPSLLPHVLRAVAAAQGRSEVDVGAETTAAARALFRLPDWL